MLRVRVVPGVSLSDQPRRRGQVSAVQVLVDLGERDLLYSIVRNESQKSVTRWDSKIIPPNKPTNQSSERGCEKACDNG
jgi:hypothetical protein